MCWEGEGHHVDVIYILPKVNTCHIADFVSLITSQRVIKIKNQIGKLTGKIKRQASE